MGYSTYFEGQWLVDPPLTEPHRKYLEAFAKTRHSKLIEDADLEADPLRDAVGLPFGLDGAYCTAFAATMNGASGSKFILGNPTNHYNDEQENGPGFWCQWTPTADGYYIEWDDGEKFYEYIDWIRYLIDNFLGPWGYKLNGQINWDGEDSGDQGAIRITNNRIDIGHRSGEWMFGN